MLATTTSVDATGLLDVLADEFKKDTGIRLKWIAVGTGAALKQARDGNADVVIVHAKKLEDEFLRDGFGVNRRVIARNYFMIVGPLDDPARVSGASSAAEAFGRIKSSGAPFVSRGDKSGTHTKELSIWSGIGVTPGPDLKWYNSLGQGMGETLLFANEQRAYTLADRGTYLSMRDRLPRLEILLGGANLAENKDKALLNPYGVLAVSPDKYPQTNFDLAMKFVAWLCSPATQKRIVRRMYVVPPEDAYTGLRSAPRSGPTMPLSPPQQ
jgi:tungstate transport system substrate-binding protein